MLYWRWITLVYQPINHRLYINWRITSRYYLMISSILTFTSYGFFIFPGSISGITKLSHKPIPCLSITAWALLFEVRIVKLDLFGSYGKPGTLCHSLQPIWPELSPSSGVVWKHLKLRDFQLVPKLAASFPLKDLAQVVEAFMATTHIDNIVVTME